MLKELTFIENITSILSNTFAIISILIALLLFIIKKIIYLFRLKKFAKTKRPYWLSEEEFYYHTHNYIKTRVIDSVASRLTFDKFVRKTINRGKKQYHIILGESGTGKSTFLINLYYRYNSKLFRHYNLQYVPLKAPDAIEQINKLEHPEKSILLLDAFDEAAKANVNANDFLVEIENNTRYFAKTIITSRNNFFDNDDEVPNNIHLVRILSLNTEKYKKYYILPFTKKDITVYILKKYKLLLHKLIKALNVIRRCGDIVCRPLVISYIDLLIQNKSSYNNTSDVYYAIITNWIKREANFILPLVEEDDNKIIEQRLMSLISEVAVFMYNSFPNQDDYYIKIEDLKKLKNADFLEHTNGKRSRSLFDRVSDRLVFAHKSILEYLLALNFDRLDFRFEKNLNILYNFLREMVGNSWNSNYSPLFHINYGDNSPKIIKDDKKQGNLCVRSMNVPVSRQFVDTMVKWYQNSLTLPVFINGKLYERVKIEFIINNKYIIDINNKKKHYYLTITDDVMQKIKECVANRLSANIVVSSYLRERF